MVDLLVRENEQKNAIHLDLYSIEDSQAERQSQAFKNTTFYFVSAYDPFRRMRGFANRLCAKLRVRFCSHVFLNRTIHLLKKKRYDWIIVENRPLYIPKLRRNLSRRTRLALHLHNDTLSSDCFYARAVIARCDLVLSVSSSIEKRVKAAGAHADKACVLYNRIDTRLFYPANDPQLQLRVRQQCGIPENRQVILYYGRLNQGKGVPNLIHAFFHAWHNNPALYLVLLGDYSSKKDQILIQHALGRLRQQLLAAACHST
ncbi:lipopolysaccharide 1,2-N-acetylglucosaminetransferase [Sporolactobacillus inulinus]|uniref:Lipopolysaccharide 1,2-N-acetylglucosaminetransferase n=1 Tax=Sporolactobacillus inulinus TaxID=2078 RepID=A0A4Y1ZET9_9BACL|nr:glycosyltransferase [Sporolactobacillus inulinus]GAY77460.1 lipopolysaccharide 1,2-N-acetylglucosaminetransferase [Sporolactobacillus inulinus]